MEKIGHYIFLFLIWTVFKLAYFNSKVDKCDTFLHNIHPGPFDPYSFVFISSLYKEEEEEEEDEELREEEGVGYHYHETRFPKEYWPWHK